MANKHVQAESTGISTQTVRVSISIPQMQYAQIESLAKGGRVSVAWVVRDAIQHYLTGQKSDTSTAEKYTEEPQA